VRVVESEAAEIRKVLEGRDAREHRDVYAA